MERQHLMLQCQVGFTACVACFIFFTNSQKACRYDECSLHIKYHMCLSVARHAAKGFPQSFVRFHVFYAAQGIENSILWESRQSVCLLQHSSHLLFRWIFSNAMLEVHSHVCTHESSPVVVGHSFVFIIPVQISGNLASSLIHARCLLQPT